MRKSVFIFGILTISLFYSYANCENNVISQKSSVKFGGKIHAQYHTSNIADSNNTNSNNSFTIRRAELMTDFNSGIVHGNIGVNFGQGEVKLNDGYGELRFLSFLKFKLGQFKKPFSLLYLTGDSEFMVIERGNNIMGADKTGMVDYSSSLKYSGRDIGAMIYGAIGNLTEYSIGIFNGNGDNKKYDDNSEKQYAGRILLKPIKGIGIGISTSNLYKDNELYQAFDIDVEYKGKGFWVQGEANYGNNHIISDTTYFAGIGLILGKEIKLSTGCIYSFFPALRFDYTFLDKNDDKTANMFVTPGININFDEHSYHKIMLNLDINQPSKENSDIQIGFRTQIQILI